MKNFFTKIGIIVVILIFAVVLGRFTYWMQDKYGNEWLWTLVRLSPLIIVLFYLSFRKKK